MSIIKNLRPMSLRAALTILATLLLIASALWITPPLGIQISLLGGGLLALFILWRGPKWQLESLTDATPQQRFELENEARKTLAEVIGGVILITGVYFTWQSLQATQDNLKLTRETSERSLKMSAETLERTSEAQITERYMKAVEQLGDDVISVRLGAIYALERLANDSPKDYPSTLEMLTGFVRQNSPFNPSKGDVDVAAKNALNVPLDIQAILTVLSRRKHRYKDGEDRRLNFVGTNLKGIIIEKDVRLEGASFREANLEGAQMSNARLEHAIFHKARLRGANLFGAHLAGADLDKADIRGADLRGVTGLTPDVLDITYWDTDTKFPPEIAKLAEQYDQN